MRSVSYAFALFLVLFSHHARATAVVTLSPTFDVPASDALTLLSQAGANEQSIAASVQSGYVRFIPAFLEAATTPTLTATPPYAITAGTSGMTTAEVQILASLSYNAGTQTVTCNFSNVLCPGSGPNCQCHVLTVASLASCPTEDFSFEDGSSNFTDGSCIASAGTSSCTISIGTPLAHFCGVAGLRNSVAFQTYSYNYL